MLVVLCSMYSAHYTHLNAAICCSATCYSTRNFQTMQLQIPKPNNGNNTTFFVKIT